LIFELKNEGADKTPIKRSKRIKLSMVI